MPKKENLPPMRLIWMLIAAGVVFIVSAEWLLPDGLPQAGLTTAVFVAITLAVAQFRDVALRRVSHSEARLQLQFTRMPNACITLDANAVVTSWNPAAERIFGWHASEIIGRPVALLLPDGFTPELAGVRDRVLMGDSVERQVNANVTKDGRLITCSWWNAPLVENGEITGILAMAEDVTEELRIEEALQESRRRHRDLIDALPHHVFSVDLEDRYLAVNPATCRFFRRAEADIIGRTPEEAGIPSEVAREWYAMTAQTRESGTTQTFDVVFDGLEPRYEHVITSPLRNHCGKIAGVTGIAIDVTARKRAEQAQRRLDEEMAHFSKMEALGTLAGGIAHDFNNILSVILAHTALLERSCPDTEPRRSARSIRQALERGAAISRQILTFAQRAELRAGSVVDVGDLVGELQLLVAETFPRTVRVEVMVEPGLPLIAGDGGQLHQALLNLCINGRDAMAGAGVLAIDAHLVKAHTITAIHPYAAACDHVVISISDDGAGMAEETRRRIFEPFFTTKEKGKGTGLGLAMVYGIVRAHDAQIDVESEPGCGTTFRLYFPVASESPVVAVTPRCGAPAHGERLLVIDDEPEILAGLEMQLSDAGYVVQTALNGPDAMERFREVPDLVLMDLGMPRMSAVELIDALRVVAPGMPILAMTGYVEPEVHTAVRNAGVSGILQKPFELRDLLGMVAEALQRQAA